MSPLILQVANGLVQTTGWPSVVTCIGNWFGKGRYGLIAGVRHKVVCLT